MGFGGVRRCLFATQSLSSIHRGWSRQRDPIENFADKKVSLNGGQVLSYDLVVEPQAKQASRVAWGFKLNDNPLDRHLVSAL
jgi:hypothetical protein